MPEIKTISELPTLPSLADSDELLLNQASSTRTATVKVITDYAKTNLQDTFINLPESAYNGQVAGFVGGKWTALSISEIAGNINDGPIASLATPLMHNYATCMMITKNNYVYLTGQEGNHTRNDSNRAENPSVMRFIDIDETTDYFAANPSVSVTKILHADDESMALLSDGTVWFCGIARSIIGLGYTDANDPELPTYAFRRVIFNSGIILRDITFNIAENTHISLGAISTDDDLYVWGCNHQGQLGLGDTANRFSPVRITIPELENNVKSAFFTGNGSEVTILSVITKDGNVWVSGHNGSGQLGQGNVTQVNTLTQAKINSTTILTDVLFSPENYYTGRYNLFFVKTDGTVWGAGNNDGRQLADGTTTASRFFKQIPGLSNIVKMKITGSAYYAYGGTQVCLSSDGKVFTWGYNAHGQCGNGTITTVNTPFEACSSGATDIYVCTGYDLRSAVGYIKNTQPYIAGHGSPHPFAWQTAVAYPPGAAFYARFIPVHLDNVVDMHLLFRRSDYPYHYLTIYLRSDGSVYATGSNLSNIMGSGDNSDFSSVPKRIM